MTAKFNSIRIVSRIHGYIYRISNGRAGRRLGTVKFLLLTTIGRRSGKKRRVPLTAISFGEKYILVASKGGSPKHPFWHRNLKANPTVEIQDQMEVHSMVVREVTNPVEKKRLWNIAVEAYPPYQEYQEKTDRVIPVFIAETIE